MRATLDRSGTAGAAILLGFLVIALVGPLLVGDPLAYVDRPLLPPSGAHWLGTTGQGQDVLAQLVCGTRTTVLLGVGVGVAVVAVGAFVGALAALRGGWTDRLVALVTNVALVLPGLPLMVVLAAWLPPGVGTIAAVLVATGWPWHARVVRAQALSLRSRDFVTAARMLGEPTWRVVAVELLPNMAGVLVSGIVGATLFAIGAEVGLAFLGLGDLGAVSWGTMLYWASNDSALLTGAWWTFVPVGTCIALTGFALALVTAALDAGGRPAELLGAPTATPVDDATTRPDTDAADEAHALLRVEDLTVRWGTTVAVEGATFTLAPGRTLGVVGESGSGKSTVVQAAFRWLPRPATVARGRVTLEGAPLASEDTETLRTRWWRDVALVPQSALASLDPLLTVGEHAAETFVAHGRCEGEAAAVLRARLADVGLPPDVAERHPHALSGGQRQRVAIALARLLDPPLLVLDEPTTALDVIVERELLRELIEVQRRDRFAMLFVTHDLPLLLGFADEVAVLYAGRIVERAPARVLREDGARHPYTRGLLAAMPAGPEEARTPRSIPGTPPDLRTPPTGCRFHPRCALATERCATTAPPLATLAPGHAVACHEVRA
jgi:peptide/nickel transport system permease protein